MRKSNSLFQQWVRRRWITWSHGHMITWRISESIPELSCCTCRQKNTKTGESTSISWLTEQRPCVKHNTHTHTHRERHTHTHTHTKWELVCNVKTFFFYCSVKQQLCSVSSPCINKGSIKKINLVKQQQTENTLHSTTCLFWSFRADYWALPLFFQSTWTKKSWKPGRVWTSQRVSGLWVETFSDFNRRWWKVTKYMFSSTALK